MIKFFINKFLKYIKYFILDKLKKYYQIKYLIIFLFVSLANSLEASPSRNLTIFAESNMSLALSKIARQFSQKNNVIVSINFNSPFDLIQEIDDGAPVNVFITAHPIIIENLRQKGLVDVYNIGYIASDNLVICSANNNRNFPIEFLKKNISFEDALKIINNNKLSLIIEHDNVSSGVYVKKIIEELALNDIKIFNKLPEDKSSIIKDIESNIDALGVVFASNLNNRHNIKSLVAKKDKDIFYQAFVVAGDNMDIAREFLNFLKTPIAKKIFEESGFVIN